MKQLIEDYERRLQTAETMLKEKDYSSSEQAARIRTKASCYRQFIAELKRHHPKNISSSTGAKKTDKSFCHCSKPIIYTDANKHTYCKWCGKDFKNHI